jgi:hypothetical protein
MRRGGSPGGGRNQKENQPQGTLNLVGEGFKDPSISEKYLCSQKLRHLGMPLVPDKLRSGIGLDRQALLL